jgi:hypothetical protein
MQDQEPKLIQINHVSTSEVNFIEAEPTIIRMYKSHAYIKIKQKYILKGQRKVLKNINNIELSIVLMKSSIFGISKEATADGFSVKIEGHKPLDMFFSSSKSASDTFRLLTLWLTEEN